MLAKILLFIVLGIIAIIFIVVAMGYFLLYIVPLIIIVVVRFCKWLLITSPLLIALFFIPTHLDTIMYLFLLVALVIRDFRKGGGRIYNSGGFTYVLNKRSKVAHPIWSSSANTISERHKEYTTESASELISRGFRIKRDD